MLPLKQRLALKKQPQQPLPHSLTPPNPSNDDNDTDMACCICYEDVRQCNRGTLESCAHIFCFDCIEQWSKKGRNCCPMCNRQFFLITASVTPVKTLKNGKKRKGQKVIVIKKKRTREERNDVQEEEADDEDEDEDDEDEDEDYVYEGSTSRHRRRRPVTRQRIAQQMRPETRPLNAQAAAGINLLGNNTRQTQQQRRNGITRYFSYLDEGNNDEDDPFMEWAHLDNRPVVQVDDDTSDDSNGVDSYFHLEEVERPRPTESRRERRGLSLFDVATGTRRRVSNRRQNAQINNSTPHMEVIDLISDDSESDSESESDRTTGHPDASVIPVMVSSELENDSRRESMVSLSESSTASSSDSEDDEMEFEVAPSARQELSLRERLSQRRNRM